MELPDIPPGTDGYDMDTVTIVPVKPITLQDEATPKVEQGIDEMIKTLHITLQNGQVIPMLNCYQKADGVSIYLCLPCGATCQTSNTLLNHVKGKKHLRKMLWQTWPDDIHENHPYIQHSQTIRPSTKEFIDRLQHNNPEENNFQATENEPSVPSNQGKSENFTIIYPQSTTSNTQENPHIEKCDTLIQCSQHIANEPCKPSNQGNLWTLTPINPQIATPNTQIGTINNTLPNVGDLKYFQHIANKPSKPSNQGNMRTLTLINPQIATPNMQIVPNKYDTLLNVADFKYSQHIVNEPSNQDNSKMLTLINTQIPPPNMQIVSNINNYNAMLNISDLNYSQHIVEQINLPLNNDKLENLSLINPQANIYNMREISNLNKNVIPKIPDAYHSRNKQISYMPTIFRKSRSPVRRMSRDESKLTTHQISHRRSRSISKCRSPNSVRTYRKSRTPRRLKSRSISPLIKLTDIKNSSRYSRSKSPKSVRIFKNSRTTRRSKSPSKSQRSDGPFINNRISNRHFSTISRSRIPSSVIPYKTFRTPKRSKSRSKSRKRSVDNKISKRRSRSRSPNYIKKYKSSRDHRRSKSRSNSRNSFNDHKISSRRSKSNSPNYIKKYKSSRDRRRSKSRSNSRNSSNNRKISTKRSKSNSPFCGSKNKQPSRNPKRSKSPQDYKIKLIAQEVKPTVKIDDTKEDENSGMTSVKESKLKTPSPEKVLNTEDSQMKATENMEISTAELATQVIEQGSEEVITLLRLLLALRKYLGSLVPKLSDMFDLALGLELKVPKSSIDIMNESNVLFMELCKEKLLGAILSGLVDKQLHMPVRIAIVCISAFLYTVEKQHKRILSQTLVVLITGASSGLGEALAHAFYAQGCRLVLAARRLEELQRVKDDLLKTHLTVPTHPPVVLPLDLAEINDLPKCVETVLEIYGHIDILINNGGVSHRGNILSTKMDVDIKIMLVNYFGPVALTKSVLPKMCERQCGHVVFVSSVQGRIAIPQRSAYAASKHALQAFADTLRSEVSHRNVSVSVVSPGYIKTALSLNALTGTGDKHGVMDATTAKGYTASYVADQILNMVIKKKKELTLCPISHKVAILLRYLMPSLFFWIMKRRAQKAISTN